MTGKARRARFSSAAMRRSSDSRASSSSSRGVAAVEFLAQAGEARFPAREAADHRRIHQQPLPQRGRGGLFFLGHLAEREVLGESRRRKPFFGAMEQRQQTAAGHIRPAGGQRAGSGIAGAPQRFENERLVALGRAQQDGDLVERHAFGGGGVDGARDFHAFQRFAGSGEDGHAAVLSSARGGTASGEKR